MALEVRELQQDDWPLWDKLITVSAQYSIFSERWWIETVTHGEGRLLGCFQGNQLVAGLPIWPCRAFGVRYLRRPLFTPYWGPLLHPLTGKNSTRIGQEINILYALAEAVAPWSDVTVSCHPTFTNWLSFYWRGFTQTTGYTYRITDWHEPRACEATFHPVLKDSLRRSQSQEFDLCDQLDQAQLRYLSRHALSGYSARETEELQFLWPELARKAASRHCWHTTTSIDREGKVLSASALVWDAHCVYNIFSTCATDRRTLDGMILRIAHEITLASTLAPTFDFNGATCHPLGKLFLCFGARLLPFHHIEKHKAGSLRLLRKHGLTQCRASMRHLCESPFAEIFDTIPVESSARVIS